MSHYPHNADFNIATMEDHIKGTWPEALRDKAMGDNKGYPLEESVARRMGALIGSEWIFHLTPPSDHLRLMVLIYSNSRDAGTHALHLFIKGLEGWVGNDRRQQELAYVMGIEQWVAGESPAELLIGKIKEIYRSFVSEDDPLGEDGVLAVATLLDNAFFSKHGICHEFIRGRDGELDSGLFKEPGKEGFGGAPTLSASDRGILDQYKRRYQAEEWSALVNTMGKEYSLEIHPEILPVAIDELSNSGKDAKHTTTIAILRFVDAVLTKNHKAAWKGLDIIEERLGTLSAFAAAAFCFDVYERDPKVIMKELRAKLPKMLEDGILVDENIPALPALYWYAKEKGIYDRAKF